jgi:ferredoxin
MTDPYELLTEKLGHPGSERLTRLLKRLMDGEEAEIVASLPCPVEELATKLGKREEEVEKKLDGLFGKGVIFVTSKGYQFARNVMQLHDATGADVRLDAIWGRELLDLWEDFCQAEWYQAWAKGIASLDTPVWRAIPAGKAVAGGTNLLPAEDLRAILDKATRFAVTSCPCRRVAGRCELPTEVCLQLNKAAEYVLARGSGRELTRHESMELLDSAAEAGLIHMVPNTSDVVSAICNCCTDCCIFYYPLIKYGGLDRGAARSRFQAEIDMASCTGCQTCVERCPLEAIEMAKVSGEKKLKAQVDPERCFGCGVCAVACETGAIRLIEVRPPGRIPA